MIAQRQTVRGQGRVEIALTFQGERLVEIIEALRLEVSVRLAAKQAAQPGHAVDQEGERPAGSRAG